jgi:hypothetical protein
MNAGGPAIVMSLNSKVPKDNYPQGNGRYENSMMTSFYGAPDEFIGKIHQVKQMEEIELK